FSSRRRHTIFSRDWSSDVCSSDLMEAGQALDGETWRAMRAFADRVAATWPQPDAGIWERRTAPRHHVHSKLMAWLALDRAARLRSEERRVGKGWECVSAPEQFE